MDRDRIALIDPAVVDVVERRRRVVGERRARRRVVRSTPAARGAHHGGEQDCGHRFSSSSRDGEIRTRDFSLPKRARYQAAPRPVRHSVGTSVRWRRSRRAAAGRGRPRPGSARCRSSPTGPRRARSAGPRAHSARARAISSGTVSTIAVARTMQTWRSGTRLSARRPCPGPPSRAIVPVSAQPAAHVVNAPSSASSSRGAEPVVHDELDARRAAARARDPRRSRPAARLRRRTPLPPRPRIVGDDDRRLVVANPLDEQLEHRGGGRSSPSCR